MWLFILAVFLGLIPFLLCLRFEDRTQGFVTVLTAVFGLHLVLGLVTQALHIFTYELIIAIHSLVAISIISWLFKFRSKLIRLPRFEINWLVLGAFLIIFFELWSVHFSYNGVGDTYGGIDIVQDSSYSYPLYSDEWVGVSLVEYSIREGALPMVNPLWDDSPFINFLAGSHVLIAELMLFFGLEPLTSYVWLAIFNTMLTCLMLFWILRKLGVSLYPAVASVLMVPLLTNSGNLPSMWFLLPYNISLNFLLIAIFLLITKSRNLFRNLDKWMILTAMVLALVTYPPMIVFVLPLLLYEFRWRGLLYLLAVGVLVLLAGLGKFGIADLAYRAWDFILRDNLDGGIVNYEPWYVMPFYIIPFIMVGMWRTWKKKYYFLLLPIGVGVVFWGFYTQFLGVIIIEHPRIVAVTSVMLLVCLGLGLQFISTKILRVYHESKQHIVSKVGKICFVIFFLSIAIFFPGRESWHQLTLLQETSVGERKVTPSPPVNFHLREDERVVFSEFSEKRFISPPWKGLVLGVSTRNFPLHSKSSTIGNKFLEYNKFMAMSCKEKSNSVKKFKIDYAYTEGFTCPGFVEVFVSGEGLHLYKASR